MQLDTLALALLALLFVLYIVIGLITQTGSKEDDTWQR